MLIAIGVYSYQSYVPFPNGQGIVFYTNYQFCLKKIFLRWLKKAENSIWIENYSIRDKDIKQTIKSTKVHDLFIDMHKRDNKRLMHKKILIIDHEYVLLGSANCTEASLLVHDNLMIGIDNKNLAKNISIKKGYYEDEQYCYFELPMKQKEALLEVLSSIRGAKKSIKLAMYCLSNKKIIEELINAAHREVKVEVIVDKHSHFPSLKPLLEEPSIKLKRSTGMALMHHKMCLIDNHEFLFGSVNWTAKGFTRNEEFLLHIKQLPLLQKMQLKRLFKRLEKN